MSDQPEIRFEEIMVALECGADSRAPVAFAADLAAGLRSRLAGLWLEDQALHSAAGYSFTREVTFAGAIRDFSAATLSRDLSAQRETLRRLLERAAARRRIEWRLAQEQPEQTGAVNRLVVAAGSAVGRLRASGDLLIYAGRAAPGPVSLVLATGDPAGQRALRVARRIAEATDQPLRALLFDPQSGEAGELRTLLAGIATAEAPEPAADPAARLRRIAAAQDRGLLVVPGALLETAGLGIAELARASAVPLLVTAA